MEITIIASNRKSRYVTKMETNKTPTMVNAIVDCLKDTYYNEETDTITTNKLLTVNLIKLGLL